MKVCVFTSWYPEANNPLYGIFVVDQVKALQHQNIDIAVCYLEKEKITTLKNKLPRIESFEAIKTYRSFIKKIPIRTKLALNHYHKQYAKSYELYKKENGKPDLIHAHNYLSASAALAITQIENIPLIVTEHAAAVQQLDLSSFQKDLCKLVYNNCNLVIAVSNQLKRSILQISPRASVAIVPNLIKDQFQFKKKNEITEQINLLAIGSLLKNKRFDLLIESVFLLNKHLKNYLIRLKIIGNGKEYSKLNKLINKLDLQENVRIHNEINNEFIYKDYLKAHLLISTSITETFGMVALEALACGTPVVTTDNGGMSDFVNANNGIVTKESNPEALSAAIKKAIFNYPNYNLKTISDNIHLKYNSKSICDKLINHYEKLSQV